MLEFIKSFHQEQVDELGTFDLKVSAEDVKAHVAVLKTRVVLLSLIFNLPQRIQDADDLIEKNKIAKERFAKSQDTGGIN